MATAPNGRGHGQVHVHIHGSHEHGNIIHLQCWCSHVRSGNVYGCGVPRARGGRGRTGGRGSIKEADGEKKTCHLCGGGCFQRSRRHSRRERRLQIKKHSVVGCTSSGSWCGFSPIVNFIMLWWCQVAGWILAVSLGNEYSAIPTISDQLFRVLSYDGNLNRVCCVFVVGVQTFWKSKYHYFFSKLK